MQTRSFLLHYHVNAIFVTFQHIRTEAKTDFVYGLGFRPDIICKAFSLLHVGSRYTEETIL
jgi:hypothetical protein